MPLDNSTTCVALQQPINVQRDRRNRDQQTILGGSAQPIARARDVRCADVAQQHVELSVKMLSAARDEEAAMVGRVDICIKNRNLDDELKPLERPLSTAFCRIEMASAKTRRQLPTLEKV